jgi:hypothetical protein
MIRCALHSQGWRLNSWKELILREWCQTTQQIVGFNHQSAIGRMSFMVQLWEINPGMPSPQVGRRAILNESRELPIQDAEFTSWAFATCVVSAPFIFQSSLREVRSVRLPTMGINTKAEAKIRGRILALIGCDRSASLSCPMSPTV